MKKSFSSINPVLLALSMIATCLNAGGQEVSGFVCKTAEVANSQALQVDAPQPTRMQKLDAVFQASKNYVRKNVAKSLAYAGVGSVAAAGLALLTAKRVISLQRAAARAAKRAALQELSNTRLLFECAKEGCKFGNDSLWSAIGFSCEAEPVTYYGKFCKFIDSFDGSWVAVATDKVPAIIRNNPGRSGVATALAAGAIYYRGELYRYAHGLYQRYKPARVVRTIDADTQTGVNLQSA